MPMSFKEIKLNSQSYINRKGEAISRYLRELNKYPLVTKEEEACLKEQMMKGGKEREKAKRRFVEANLRIVISVAAHYSRNDAEFEDFIEEGNIGLIRATDEFDPTKEVKFITYAINWIRQSILDAMDKYNAIHVPDNAHKLISKFNKMNKETLEKEGHELSIDEFAEAMQCDANILRKALIAKSSMIDMDAPLYDDSEGTACIGDTFSSDSITDYAITRESALQNIEYVLANNLTPVEALVVKEHYGIGRYYDRNFDDIAQMIGKSRERTRCICLQAIEKLKHSQRLSA